MSVASVAPDFGGPPAVSQQHSDLVTLKMSVASVAGTLLGHLHLPNSPVTLRNVIGPGLCQTTGSFPNGPVTLWPLEIQWPQWSRTLLGHWHFYKGPETWWPWEMSKPSVARDFVGHLHFPNSPVTLRNVSGLSDPGLWWATGSFPTVAGTLLGHLHLLNSPATLKNVIGPGLCQTTGSFPNGPVTRWPLEISVASVACDFAGALAPFPNNQVTRGDPEKCQWPQWPRTLLGHWHFYKGPETWWPWEMSVASVAQDIAGSPALSQQPSDPVTMKNVSGLSGLGLCWVIRTLPGHLHFPNSPVTRWP